MPMPTYLSRNTIHQSNVKMVNIKIARQVAQYVLEQLQQIMFTELHRQVRSSSLYANVELLSKRYRVW